MGIPTLRKRFTSQNVFIVIKYSKHFIFSLNFPLPSSHMLNLVICNCEGATMCCLDAPLEKTCHPAAESIASSQPSSGIVSVKRSTWPMATSLWDLKTQPSCPDSGQLCVHALLDLSVRLCESRDCSLPGSSVHEMFQAIFPTQGLNPGLHIYWHS